MVSRTPVVVMVSIDTEEDNWKATREGVTTKNIAQLPGLQRRFESLGVRPTYFTNYQVAVRPESKGIIRELHLGGKAEIGAHVHPWNTPPLLPTLETMLLNVAPEAQAAKIRIVTETLTDLLGHRPGSFRAGRFGLGPSTARALIAAGYSVDSSITPFFSWERHGGGPSHVGAPLHIYRISGRHDVRLDDGGPLIEVPLTCGYNRWPPRAWPRMYSTLNTGIGRALHLPGIVSRLGVARNVILSPEVHDVDDLLGVARSVIRGGLGWVQVFWHSPSMEPGLSPFCQSRADVDRLIGRFEQLLEGLDREATLRFATIGEAAAELAPPPALAPPDAVLAAHESPLTMVIAPGSAEVSAADAPGAAAAAEAPGTGPIGKHTAVYLAGILLARGVSFVMLPFYTNYLSRADYGIMQLLEMTLDIISIVAGARIASGVHRYYFEGKTDLERRHVLSTAFVLLLLSFGGLGLLTWLFAPQLTRMVLGSAEHAGLMRIAAMNLALQGLLIVPMAIFQLWRRSVTFTALNTSRLFIQLSLNILFLAGLHMGVRGVFVSTLIANILVGGWLLVYMVRAIGLHVSPSVARSLYRYGLPLVGTQFATFFVAYGDRYFLRVHGSLDQVGLYALAYQFGFIVATLGYMPFSLVWEPTRFQVAARPDRDAIYARAFIFMNVILLSATVGTALFVRDFIMVMSGEQFHSAYLIVPVILVAYVLQSWASFHEVGILVSERTGFVTLANWVAALVALGGYVLLIPRWLGWGAAIATVLAFMVREMITFGVAQRLVPVKYDWPPVWRLVAVATGFTLLGLMMPHPGVVLSVLIRVVIYAAYIMTVWHIGVITPGEKAKVLRVLRSPRSAMAEFSR